MENGLMRYRTSKLDCQGCSLEPQCCPNAPPKDLELHPWFAYLKRILRLDRLRLRGPDGARDEFHLGATAQNLRKLAKLIPAPPPIPATVGKGMELKPDSIGGEGPA